MTVKDSWDAIHEWLQRNHPMMIGLLRGPAVPTDIEALESEIGYVLPDDFKSSYSIHDGSDSNSGIMIGLPLMSVAEITRTWESWAKIAADKTLVQELSEPCQSHPSGAIKPLYANRGWIPFAGDSNFIAIDFDPGPVGRAGQIINAGRDDEIRHVIAGTFEGFLSFVAKQFASGRVGLNPEDDPDDPRWLSVAGRSQDLLTGLRSLLGLEK